VRISPADATAAAPGPAGIIFPSSAGAFCPIAALNSAVVLVLAGRSGAAPGF